MGQNGSKFARWSCKKSCLPNGTCGCKNGKSIEFFFYLRKF